MGRGWAGTSHRPTAGPARGGVSSSPAVRDRRADRIRARGSGLRSSSSGSRSSEFEALFDDVVRDVDDPPAAAPGRVPEQVEGIAGAEAVALGEDPDGLLDPDPGGQRVLELGDRHSEPRRLVRFDRLVHGASVPSRSVAVGRAGPRRGRRGAGGRGAGGRGAGGRRSGRARGRRPAGRRAPWRSSGRTPPRRRRPSAARICGRPFRPMSLARSSAAASPDQAHPLSASSAIRFFTCAADGLTITLPSGNTIVGTVWLPPLTLIT